MGTDPEYVTCGALSLWNERAHCLLRTEAILLQEKITRFLRTASNWDSRNSCCWLDWFYFFTKKDESATANNQKSC